ncbi:MAG: hypothetical protein IPK35_04595 [Saprospiraceae bacterium]|jgi:streptogramin lyase|nr:hypothetical protein [Saprospiraceae bacterium]
MWKFSFVFYLLLTISSCHTQNARSLNKELLKKSSKSEWKLIKSKNKNPADNVHCSIMDKDGNLWFATTDDGIFYPPDYKRWP